MYQHQHIFVTNSQVCSMQSLLQGGHSLEKTLTLYQVELCSMYMCMKYDISLTVFHQECISMGSLSKSVYSVNIETGQNLPEVLKIVIHSARYEPLLLSTGRVFYFSIILSGLWAPT